MMEDSEASNRHSGDGKEPYHATPMDDSRGLVAPLYEAFPKPAFRLYYQPTLGQTADIVTRPSRQSGSGSTLAIV